MLLAKNKNAGLPSRRRGAILSAGRGSGGAPPPEPVTSDEAGLIALLAASPTFGDVLAERAPLDMVDEDGAVGDNQSSLVHPTEQRDVLWLAYRGLVEDDADILDDVVRALEWGFDQQNEAGYFENGLSVEPEVAVGADAFFVQCFGRIRNMIAGSSHAATFAARFEAMEATLGDALGWLDANQAELYDQDDNATNRLWTDASAFTLGGLIAANATALTNGDTFAGYGYTAQDAAGWFNESGGFDSSYQGVSILRMAETAMGMPAGANRAAILASMEDAAAWLITRISGGEVSAVDNTRTGPASPENKEINYYEAALSLFMAGYVLDDAGLIAVAEDVSAFILAPRLTAALVDSTVRSGTNSVANVPIGDAAADRRVVMALAINNATPGTTIGGETAEVHVTSAYSSPLTGYRFFLVSVVLETGTTATVATSAGTGLVVMGVWTVTGAPSIETDTLSTGWGVTAAGTIDMAAKGCVIGHVGGIETSALSFAWGGLIEVFDSLAVAGGMDVSGAGLNQVSAQTGRTVGAVGTGGAGYTHMGVVSFEPTLQEIEVSGIETFAIVQPAGDQVTGIETFVIVEAD